LPAQVQGRRVERYECQRATSTALAPTFILHPAPERIPDVPTQRSSTVRLRTSLFQEATEIVDREFASELSLDGIARRVASSRRQLQRAYAEIGRTTFRDHLTRVRMQKAADMLATRSLTVREVAHRVGYRQPAQFAKAFRRYQGVAPSDFRANGAGRSNGDGSLAMDGRFVRSGAAVLQDGLQAA
jgi:AraC family transcriptional regulator, regulatory protein of adaptative response / methylphosphotriester-DNA alkyltransferase methyltransferase